MTSSDCEIAKLDVQQHDWRLRLMNRLRRIPCLGLFMAFCSGICFATAGFTVELMQGEGKEGGRGVDASLIVSCRSLIQAIFYIPAALILKDPLFGISGERWYLFQRAAFGYICFTLSYYSLKFVSLSDSSSIVFSAPVFVSIFACIILHEPCGVFQITNVFFTLVGVILISHPSFIFGGTGEDANFTAGDRLIGAILAFLSCLTMAYTFVSMRRLQKTPTTSVIAFFSMFCVVCGGVTVIIMHFAVPSYEVRTLSSDDWIFLVINGLCGVFGQLFLVTALKIEEAGLVSLVRTFDIVMSFIYQVFCLHQSAPLLSIIGAAIVFCGCVACGLKKFFASKAREEESDIISDMDERTSCETIDTIKR